MVAALFIRKDSYYREVLPSDKCFGEKENALTYRGNDAVITHPPCQLWGQLCGLSTRPKWERWYAIWAINLVRRNGGILEHPRASRLFPHYLPYPGKADVYGGYTLSIDQSWFGLPVRKRTLIYICGVALRNIPDYPFSLNAIEYRIGTGRRRGLGVKPEAPRKYRDYTTPALANYLIEVCQLIEQNKKRTGSTL